MRSFKPKAASDGYWPGLSTVQGPLKAVFWHTSQRWPVTTAEEARSLKPLRLKSVTGWLAEKDRP